MIPPQILRASERKASRWKNGGGTTYQIAAFPRVAGLDDFDWRVSTAEIIETGVFSRFPDTDRALAVISGKLDLAIADRSTVRLDSSDAAVQFPGDVCASGTPVDGPVIDLNVITRRGAYAASIERYGPGAISVSLRSDTIHMIIALKAAIVNYESNEFSLDPFDAILFDQDLKSGSFDIVGNQIIIVMITSAG